ncbi:hypothetical protein OPT61_g6135 [Boeremia exigua]|uniref:Uncharacterized protein n=1 Tax=Boeremia exigua TaxID=749465 RepID=A0ACC2I7R7_9PLEO|nr:hypothetical protein OPT61_g6135 [Boeremia exigua]
MPPPQRAPTVYEPSVRSVSPPRHEHEKYVEIERSATMHGPATAFLPEGRQLVRQRDRTERDIREEIRSLEEERQLLKYERGEDYDVVYERRDPRREVVRVDRDRKECRYPVKTLYTEYSKADDRALGKGVRLTQCPRCKKFADKYVEHDFVVLFIDLVLIKPQVRDHLQRVDKTAADCAGVPASPLQPPRPRRRQVRRKRPPSSRAQMLTTQRSILRLGILLLLFDVYLTWARIEKLPLPHDSPHRAFTPTPTNAAILQAQPLILQYLFFLLLVTLSTLAFHLPIRLLTSFNPAALPPALRSWWASLIPYYPHPTPLSTALLVSSCTKLFPILLIIWDYDLPSSATAVSWAVIVNNVAALEILMDCGYISAGLLVAIGAGLSWVISASVVREAGLGSGWEDNGGVVEGVVGDIESWIRGLVGVG